MGDTGVSKVFDVCHCCSLETGEWWDHDDRREERAEGPLDSV